MVPFHLPSHRTINVTVVYGPTNAAHDKAAAAELMTLLADIATQWPKETAEYHRVLLGDFNWSAPLRIVDSPSFLVDWALNQGLVHSLSAPSLQLAADLPHLYSHQQNTHAGTPTRSWLDYIFLDTDLLPLVSAVGLTNPGLFTSDHALLLSNVGGLSTRRLPQAWSSGPSRDHLERHVVPRIISEESPLRPRWTSTLATFEPALLDIVVMSLWPNVCDFRFEQDFTRLLSFISNFLQ